MPMGLFCYQRAAPDKSSSSRALEIKIRRFIRIDGISPARTASYAAALPMPRSSAASSTVTVIRAFLPLLSFAAVAFSLLIGL